MQESLLPEELAAYGRSGVTLELSSRTDVGLVRANNEDTVVASELSGGRPLSSGKLGPAGLVLGVCDGMGGAAAGEVASRIAAQVLTEELVRVPLRAEAAAYVAAVRAAVRAAGDAIRNHAAKHTSRKGMGTTCSVAAVRGGLMVVAHVGDSRVYLLRDGALRQLTRDQTWENALLDQGRVKESELAELERGKAIVQAVGTTEDLAVEMIVLELRRGDVVLACSDGLSGMVPHDHLSEVLLGARDLESATDELVRRALEGGGRDNVSCVVARFTGAALRPSAGYEPVVRLPMTSAPRFGAVALAVLAAGVVTLAVHVGRPTPADDPRTRAPAEHTLSTATSTVSSESAVRGAEPAPAVGVTTPTPSALFVGQAPPAEPPLPTRSDPPRRPTRAATPSQQAPAAHTLERAASAPSGRGATRGAEPEIARPPSNDSPF
jgi:serine/threonine protein phosphatase PrpC